jgi:hypothetical protein
MTSPSITLPRQVAWTRQFVMLIAAVTVALVIALAVLASRPGHASSRTSSRSTPYVGTVNSGPDNPSNLLSASSDCLSRAGLTHVC